MNAIVFYLAYPFLFIVSRLPFPVFYKLSDLVCFFLYRVFGYRKAAVRSNLKLAFPDYSDEKLSAIERKFYSHLCDLFLEIIKSMGMSKEEMIKRFHVKNIDVLTQFEKENRSVFLMCGHYASWEWMMSLGYHMKHKGYGIYKPISNPYFDNLIKKIRSRHDAYMISQRKAAEEIKRMEDNDERGVFGFASDQSPRPKPLTYWRSFMGIQVPVFTGAERMAREFNIPVVYAKMNRIKRGYYEVEFKLLTATPNELPPNGITDTYTEWLEAQIKEDPSQYFWTHKRFKHTKVS
ncbi:MAG: lysophospholipid acyltransferase family protein [Flavobacteriaceae bacterium]|nr:lysophospholipid acyltransferase family protein [Flavobacteriaceae bacterium]MDG1912176.1 lysophospholipid acyltransferase family protein [Flavobacteriaceae bacterium]